MNIFGSTEDMKKKKICDLAVSRTKEKKKFLRKGDWMGYCPFFSLGHDTIDCIVT